METRSYTKKELRKLMEATGYPMASIEKTMRLLELLKAINADEFLGANLTLKGRTAINIIHYSEIPRLSVGLDFDLARNTLEQKGLHRNDKSATLIRKCIADYLSLSRGIDIEQALEAIWKPPKPANTARTFFSMAPRRSALQRIPQRSSTSRRAPKFAGVPVIFSTN